MAMSTPTETNRFGLKRSEMGAEVRRTNVSRGIWSDGLIRKHNASPYGVQRQPHHLLDLAAPLTLVLGSIAFQGGEPTISIDDVPLFQLRNVEGEGVLVNARFFDDTGNLTIEIRDSELLVCADQWDVTIIGREVKVRRGLRDIVFEAIIHPPHGVFVQTVNLVHANKRITSDATGHVIVEANGKPTAQLLDVVCVCGGGIKITDNGLTAHGGSAFIPFPCTRFSAMARAGQLDTLFSELFGPTIHVLSRDGHWGIQNPKSTDLLLDFETHSAALEAAVALRDRIPHARIIEHDPNGAIRFLFKN
jgi:hypothetical protein